MAGRMAAPLSRALLLLVCLSQGVRTAQGRGVIQLRTTAGTLNGARLTFRVGAH